MVYCTISSIFVCILSKIDYSIIMNDCHFYYVLTNNINIKI